MRCEDIHRDHCGMEQFARDFLKSCGAVLESSEGVCEALLPEPLSSLLELPEYFSFKEGLPPSGEKSDLPRYYLHYGSPLLEKMISAISSKVPLIEYRLDVGYLKSQGFDRLVNESFSFVGAVGKVKTTAVVKTEYIDLTCRYQALSDEQKEGLVSLTFNSETGAVLSGMESPLATAPKTILTPDSKGVSGRFNDAVIRLLRVHLNDLITLELAAFQESMARRHRRDVTNLVEYYTALGNEMERSLERPGLSDQIIRERREKIALLPDELQRKSDDLFKKYSIRVKVVPCSIKVIKTPAVKVLYAVAAGKRTGSLSLIYNPLTKQPDPVVCAQCHRSITTVYFGDSMVPLCSRCAS